MLQVVMEKNEELKYSFSFNFFFFFMLAESATGPVSYSRDTGSIPTATTITSRCHTYAPSSGTGKSGGFELETSSYITRYIHGTCQLSCPPGA
jgi:hypothetical protein